MLVVNDWQTRVDYGQRQNQRCTHRLQRALLNDVNDVGSRYSSHLPSAFPLPDAYFLAAHPGKTAIRSTPVLLLGFRLLLIFSPAHAFQVCFSALPPGVRGSFWATYPFIRLDAEEASDFQERISLDIVSEQSLYV